MSDTPKLPKISIADLDAFVPNTALESLGIKFTRITDEFIEASMPVDRRTHQPFGFLHGGASALLAESLGSVGAALMIDTKTHRCVGIEINANHLGAVRSGSVVGTARPLHVGKSTEVWDIRIQSDAGKLVCVSRLTLAVTELRA